MPDMVEGLLDYLRADPAVSTLTQGRIYNSELPPELDDSMPLKALVMRPAGGPGGPALLQIQDGRVVIFSYAETHHLAQALDGTVYASLKALTPSVWHKTYIHWCKLSGSATSSRDATTQWPYVMSIWVARASDLDIP